ncbi:hypothetical protein J7E96_06380 [Streptomyces sp. ISL-96]|uniref:hypothetical protein n=1 Tax=Streptomyces sp. ISL-96 TaxID=2819191 RepID=UPI001BEACB50|nr:hypothetical protein [Streptomyces sp. ISL-96]MBT2488157.1 hypothetical protein [Streptomyces sp. ISL-96]
MRLPFHLGPRRGSASSPTATSNAFVRTSYTALGALTSLLTALTQSIPQTGSQLACLKHTHTLTTDDTSDPEQRVDSVHWWT